MASGWEKMPKRHVFQMMRSNHLLQIVVIFSSCNCEQNRENLYNHNLSKRNLGIFIKLTSDTGFASKRQFYFWQFHVIFHRHLKGFISRSDAMVSLTTCGAESGHNRGHCIRGACYMSTSTTNSGHLGILTPTLIQVLKQQFSRSTK